MTPENTPPSPSQLQPLTFREDFFRKLSQAPTRPEQELLVSTLEQEVRTEAQALSEDCKAFQEEIYRTKRTVIEEQATDDDKEDVAGLETLLSTGDF